MSSVEAGSRDQRAVPGFSVRQQSAPVATGPQPEHGPTRLPRALQVSFVAPAVSEKKTF